LAAGYPSPGFFVSVHSKDDQAACFDTLLQVLILKELREKNAGNFG
jgi:hypothetical protein